MDKYICCADCNKKLVQYAVKPSDMIRTFIVNCPFCGSESLPIEIEGKTFFNRIYSEDSSHPTMLDNIELDNNKWRIKVHACPI